MKIVIGADSVGYPLKQVIKQHLIANQHEVEDIGVNSPDEDTPYYVTAHAAAESVMVKRFDRAILFCGTGMGMAIIANKHPGIYAAVCESPMSAETSRTINDANVLALGAFFLTETVAKKIVDVWLTAEFTEGWGGKIQEWLRDALKEIASFEKKQF